MPGSSGVLEDRYSEVVVNVMALVLKWQLFSLMWEDHGMITNSTGDRLYCEHEPW